MKEDIWFQTERKYFAELRYKVFKLQLKNLNKILEEYNKFLQDALIGEDGSVPENLRLTILYARGGNNAPDAED